MIVEVDPETAMVEIKRYLVVHDCGTIINPLLVEGQIHGGVAHGIGNAFYEQLVYDEQGQLLNASFMDYLLPTATDVPPIETAHRETPSPFNPSGLKGVGEAGCIPTGAVFAQAVEDALAGSGVEITEIPLSPNRLFELDRAGRRRSMILERHVHIRRPRATRLGAAAGSRRAGQGAAGHEDADQVGDDRYRRRHEGERRPGDRRGVRRQRRAEGQSRRPRRFAMQIDGKGGVGFTQGHRDDRARKSSPGR